MDDIGLLSRFLSERRKARIEEVLSKRTYNLTMVFEELHDPHNIAAVIRTAEAFGIQRVFIIPEKDGKTGLSRKITRAADKWIDIRIQDSIVSCLSELKEQDFSILVSSLGPKAKSIREFSFKRRTAMVLGNEKNGVSKKAYAMADGVFVVPMLGFVESLNVSVAAGLALYHATMERARLLGKNGDLTEQEKAVLRRKWYRQSVKGADMILERMARK
ncbi:MAG: RNA methyltransferase [Deltaproteobacteria bacterium]|nr:RNA methyltransferase [Deltaproteobacteria bacterium]